MVDPSDERLEAEARILEDPVAYTLFNPAQIRAIDALNEDSVYDGVTIIISTMGNGTGKTFVHYGAILGAIFFGTANPLFATKIYQEWPFPKSARLMGPSDLFDDKGPIQKAIKECWPADRYTQKRGRGRDFYAAGECDEASGWDWDVRTYNQQGLQLAGSTKGITICTEPPPQHLLGEMVGRHRAGGVILIEMTPLDYAAYLEEMAEEGSFKGEDGEIAARVIRVRGDIHDNCAEHSEGGQLPHKAIMATVALWPVEEREARRTGAFMTQAGRIYKKWNRDVNVLAELPEYHQKHYDAGSYNLTLIVDPHDRKPYAMAWIATFPNGDAITLAEWPDEGYPPFRDIKDSPVVDIDDYREIILATEKELGKTPERRLIDPNFGNAPKAGANGKTVSELFNASCRACAKDAKPCSHRISFKDPPNNIPEGHTLVRAAIGNLEEGKRPKFYVLDHCKNMIYAMGHYGYKENPLGSEKGPSEKPELVHKDFCDLPRYFYLYGADRYQEATAGPTVTRMGVGRRRSSRGRA